MSNNVLLKDGRTILVDKRQGDYFTLPSGGIIKADKVRTVYPNRNNIFSKDLVQFKHNLRK